MSKDAVKEAIAKCREEQQKHKFPDLYARKWQSVDDDSKDNEDGSDNPELTVVQFNVLADGLGPKSFVKCPQESLAWEPRKHRLFAEILACGGEQGPDLVFAQEVNHFEDWMQPALASIGLEGMFIEKRPSPCVRFGSPPDGLAFFYRKSRFAVLQKVHLNMRKADGTFMSQVCMVNELMDLKTKSPLLVVSTHLKAKPPNEDIRVQQLEFIHEEVTRLLGSRDVPIIFAGDLNTEPGGAVYDFITKTWGLASAYARSGAEPSYTTWKVRDHEVKHTIDFIFYTASTLSVTGVLSPPAEDTVDEGRFPSYKYPSDHVAIAAKLKLKL